MELENILKETKNLMKVAVDSLDKEYGAIRTGRLSPDIVSSLKVEAYGAFSVLSQVANISVVDSKTISISVWDKGLVMSVEKAIRNSDLAINPNVEGTVLKLFFPPLSEERRLELIKVASKKTENFKIEIRNIRRDALDKIKKLKGSISDDEIEKYNDLVQKQTDEYIKEIENLFIEKRKELEKI